MNNNIFFNMKYNMFVVTVTILIFFPYWKQSEVHAAKQGNFTTSTLIPTFSDILTILINGTVHIIGNCTKDVNGNLVEYWLYTQLDSSGKLLTDLEHVDSNKAVILILHGWNGNKNSSYIVALKDAYVQRYDANIIVVDYGPYANFNYLSAYCNAPYVAQNVVNFICQLNHKRQVDISSIHLLGHSLGGQIAGMVGKGIQDKCNKTIGRITGLDPAGPLYQGVNTNARLDKTDATFVDIIHSNEGQFGYIGEIGHVDFYPNGGIIQPGCPSSLTNRTVLANFTLDSIIDLSLSYVTCNHQRSCFLFAESIVVNSFYSTSVLSCFGVCVPDKVSPSHCYMGENLRAAPLGINKQFTCSTADKPKYGKGPDESLT